MLKRGILQARPNLDSITSDSRKCLRPRAEITLTKMKKISSLPCFVDRMTIQDIWNTDMKKTSSLKSLKKRDKKNKVVRRRDGKGKMRMYVINKDNPRMKAKQ